MSPADRFFEGIYWYQMWEIEPGLVTPGTSNDVVALLSGMRAPADMSGMRVLDIGPWNGCCSFECERRGAAEVIAIGVQNPEETGFNKIKRHLKSNVEHRLGSVYDLNPVLLGKFDFILFFGVLYHLRYPLLGLDNIRRVSRGTLLVESACADNNLATVSSGTSIAKFAPAFRNVPFMEFYRSSELGGDSSNWFSPNSLCMTHLLLSSGFDPEFVEVYGHRLRAKATAMPGLPEFMTSASSEGSHFDLSVGNLFRSNEDFRL